MTSATRLHETLASQSPCSLETFQRTTWAGTGCSLPMHLAQSPSVGCLHTGSYQCPQPRQTHSSSHHDERACIKLPV